MSWDQTTAVGGAVIAALTLVSALYLFYSLMSHGRGKLRVQLLIGIVVCDIIIGLVALPSEAMYIAGRPLLTGTKGCDAQAFMYTAVLFSQNLWTGSVAVATFMLLKHPLSHFTTAMERYAMLSWPIIWGLSFVHSAIWYVTIGFDNTATGGMCYYGTTNPRGGRAGLDRDLMQFVPRAAVFVLVAYLYVQLFSFLRRPDTIQLSSNLEGSVTSTPTTPRSAATNIVQSGKKNARAAMAAMNPATCVTSAASIINIGDKERRTEKDDNDIPPWERLSFMELAQYQSTTQHSQSQIQSSTSINRTPRNSRLPALYLTLSSPASNPETPTTLVPELESESLSSSTNGANLSGSQYPYAADPERGLPLALTLPWRPRTPGSSSSSPRTPTTLVPQTPTSPTLLKSILACPPPTDVKRSSSHAGYPDDPTASLKRVDTADSMGPTLTEFFLANQLVVEDTAPPRKSQHMSAAAYFNRQASLLMLWFPLAYMLVFSTSLLRLVYDMVKGTPSPFLALLSAWTILSVGLVDAAVFGLAEIIVRRRVRQQMPDRLG